MKPSEKMYLIAEKLNELNKFGFVKKFKANEEGYAKIIQIRRGCSIFIHHLKDDILIINLMISKTAGSKYPEITKRAAEKFHEFFKDKIVKKVPWQHSLDKKNTYQRFYVDVTNSPFDEILKMVGEISDYYGSL